MSSTYLDHGRSVQKHRTRDALVAAARALVAEGVSPTVELAADAASVSRTTAYRYFPNQRALVLAAHPEVAATTLLNEDAPDDPGARLDLAIAAFTALIADTETQQRTMLRLSLEIPPTEREPLLLRQGRAIGWITEALEGLRGRLSDEELTSLVFAIRATTGIEALVWLTDVAGVPRAGAAGLMRWSARALFQWSLIERPPSSR